MHQYNKHAMAELIEEHEETRRLALDIVCMMNAHRRASHDSSAGLPWVAMSPDDPRVLAEVYRELRDKGLSHPACVAKYDQKVETYTRRT
jgi:hypothetical protein